MSLRTRVRRAWDWLVERLLFLLLLLHDELWCCAFVQTPSHEHVAYAISFFSMLSFFSPRATMAMGALLILCTWSKQGRCLFLYTAISLVPVLLCL